MLSNKKILFIPEFAKYGGTRTYFKQAIRFFYENGFSATVAIEDHQIDDEIRKLINEYSFGLYVIKKKSSFSRFFLRSLVYDFFLMLKMVIKLRPSRVVISVGALPNYILAFLLPARILYVIHTYPSSKNGLSSLIPQIILNIFLSKNRRVLTVSEFSKKNIIQYWGIIMQKKQKYINVVYNYSEEHISLENTDSSQDVVLTIGHVRWYKNPIFWIDVAKKVTDSCNGKNLPTFIWAGDGEMLNECRDKCKGYDNIKFIGYCPSPEKLYGDAMIYFQPSLLESHGISVVEAMKNRVPCVVSNIGGLPESIINEICGVVLKSWNVDDAALCIRRLLDDEKLRSYLANNAKERFDAMFNKKKWTKLMKNILNNNNNIVKNEKFLDASFSDELPLVSVIIPTFNCSAYLCRAIDSVLFQKHKKTEIIIIDDASTDDTQDMLRQKYGQNKSVQVILNKINLKQGASRNIGMERAKGKYIFFLDADDWVREGIFDRLLSIAEKYDAEIVACGVDQIWEDGKFKKYHSHEFVCAGRNEALSYYANYKIGSIVWNKIYLRSFIEEKKIQFVDSNGKEDVIFTLSAIYNCKKYISIKDVFYNYYQRSDSCVNSVPNIAHFKSFIQLYLDFIKFIDDNRIACNKKGEKLSRALLKAHCLNDAFPNLVRYANTRKKADWEAQCFTACSEVLGVSGYALADFLILAIEKYRKKNFIEKISSNLLVGSLIGVMNRIANSKLRKPARKFWYTIRFKKIP